MSASRLAAAALLGAAVLVGSGCARRAPSPDQCVAFAERALGLRWSQAQRSPRQRDVFESLVIECLVEPYDRELLDCVRLRGTTRACYAGYRARRAGRSPELPPGVEVR